MLSNDRWWTRPKRGQVLIIFTLMIAVFFGFLALVIDTGFLYGQRRYDQNGADAAALAAARYLALNASPYNAGGTTVYFSVTDASVYQLARQYGGLNPNNSSNVPTGTNQNANLNSTNQLDLSLEYAADGTTWCYSPSTPKSPVCTLPAGNYPPLPTSSAYKIRVTVQSTTNSALLGFLSSGPNMVTSAQTVAVINGSASYVGGGMTIPATAADCQVAPVPGNTLYQLWGSSGNSCGGFSFGNWASIVDLSSDTTWCNDSSGGSGSNPDYKYKNLLPSTSHVGGGICTSNPSDTTWNRSGFSPDSTYVGSGVVSNDLQWWIARGFQGAVAVGNKLPTYLDANPSQSGNQGQNIAAGFYCGPSGISANACPTSINIGGTYFFAQNQVGFHNICPDAFGTQYGVGCRDATVLTWGNPESPQGSVASSTQWQSVNSSPDRVQVDRLLNFRFYCDHANDGTCSNPPKSVVGNAANSDVWGRFVSPFASPCPTCTGGPSLEGNTATLGS